jgi:hypothetical protein
MGQWASGWKCDARDLAGAMAGEQVWAPFGDPTGTKEE